MRIEMDGIIETGRRVEQPVTKESVRSAVTQAGNRTIEALKGHLDPEKRTFYEGLLENLNGARVWLTKGGLRLTSSVALAATFLTSCAPAVVGPVIEVEGVTPTSTLAIPTETPTPRPTSTPTTEPSPTVESIPGINTPVEAEGIRMTFTDATVADEYNASNGKKYYPFPGSGYRLLVIEGKYSGDVLSLFREGGLFYGNKKLNVEGKEWASYRMLTADRQQNGFFYMVYFIRDGDEGPFILHDTVHGWDVDLSKIPPKN